MVKLVVSEFVTLDGVMEDPGGAEGFAQGGWAFRFDRGPEGDQFKLDELRASDALLLGRRTYEGFAAAWPNRPEDEFSVKFNTMRKYVVSRTLDRADWANSTIIRDHVVDEIGRLKQQPGGDLLVNGSAQLVQLLIANKLVDEYRLMIFPVVLGGGQRLFGDALEPTPLRFVSSRPAGAVVIVTLQP